MKRALLAVVVITMAMCSSGCLHHNLARNGGGRCGCRQCCPGNAYGANGAGGGGAMNGQSGAYASSDPNGAYGASGGGGANGGCRTCGRGLGGGGRPGSPCNYDPSVHYSDGGQPGPAAAQVAYPYYTTRGPRDFLLNNPGSIGR